MNYIKEIVKRGLGGAALGVLVSYIAIIIYAIPTGQVTLSLKGLLFQGGISFLVGFYCAASSVVYNVDHWSLLRQTITHFIVMSLYLPIAYIARWMPRSAVGIIGFIAFYILFYVIQWIIFYSIWKQRAIRLNEGLKRFNQLREVE